MNDSNSAVEPQSAAAEAPAQTSPDEDEEMEEVKERGHSNAEDDERPNKFEKPMDEPSSSSHPEPSQGRSSRSHRLSVLQHVLL